MEKEANPEKLKDLGNQAVKNEKFEEAILHYTYAIKLDPTNYTLHSNRSYTFLKVQQYYLALEDANETITLNPSWPKGYFRKGEVEFATGHYEEACMSYREALKLKPGDVNILEALNKTVKEILREKKADQTIPWVGAGIGIIIGVGIVIADCLFTYKPTHPMLMALITIVISLTGYGIARFYRYWSKTQKTSLIEPPLDLLADDDKKEAEDTTNKENKVPRYTKSQARQRYKKGKS